MSSQYLTWSLDQATLTDASILSANSVYPRRIIPLTKYSALVLADGPAVFFQFEELSGTTIADTSTNNITGSLVSGTFGLAGLEGSSLASNGGTGPAARMQRHASVEPLISQAFTIEFWHYGQIYTTGVTTLFGNNGAWWVFTNGGVLNLRVGNGGAYKDFQLNSTAGVAGQWNHFMVAYDGLQNSNSAVWYLNGVLTNQLTQNFGMGAFAYSAGAQIIADNQPAGTKIDNFAFYNKLLPAASATAHFSGASPSPSPKAVWTSSFPATTGITNVNVPVYGYLTALPKAVTVCGQTTYANEFLTGTVSGTSGSTLSVTMSLEAGQFVGGFSGSSVAVFFSGTDIAPSGSAGTAAAFAGTTLLNRGIN